MTDTIPPLIFVVAAWTILWCAIGVYLIRARRRRAIADDRFTSELLDARADDRERKKVVPRRVDRKPLPGLPMPESGGFTLAPCQKMIGQACVRMDETRFVSGLSVVFGSAFGTPEYQKALQGTVTLYIPHSNVFLGPWPLSMVMAFEKASEPVFAFDEPIVLPRASRAEIAVTNGPTKGTVGMTWILHGSSVPERAYGLYDYQIDLQRGVQPQVWPEFVPGKEKF